MIIKKSAKVGNFAIKKQDYNDGDVFTILDGGKEVEGKFGPQNVFKVKLKKGEFAMPFNATSCENLSVDYGEDTEDWAGKDAKVNFVKMLVAGSMQTVSLLTHPDKTLENYEEGEVVEEINV